MSSSGDNELDLLRGAAVASHDAMLATMQEGIVLFAADHFGDTKTLDVHVKRLRQKVELDPRQRVHLVTVRGLGYRFGPRGRRPLGWNNVAVGANAFTPAQAAAVPGLTRLVLGTKAGRPPGRTRSTPSAPDMRRCRSPGPSRDLASSSSRTGRCFGQPPPR